MGDRTDDSITVRLNTGSGQKTFALTDATVIDKAESGATADIEKGSTVFVRTRRGDNGELEAWIKDRPRARRL